MQRVTGLDEMYLSLDTGRTVGHVAGIAFFDAPDVPVAAGSRLAFLKERVAERLSSLPLLRWRLQTLPLWIDQRRWAEVEHLNLNDHITGVVLPRPGSVDQLHAFLDTVMSQPLPRDRPMWRIYLVEGLADGRYAYVIKLSHGLADGSALWSVFDLLSDHPSEPADPALHAPEPTFGTAELLARGAVGFATTPLRVMAVQGAAVWWGARLLAKERTPVIPATIARLVPGELSRPFERWANAVRRDSGSPVVTSSVPTLRPPASPFNGDVTSDLGMAWVDMSVPELKRVGALVGGTVNDAILAITAGALRRYLVGHGGIPTRPLIASAPISWRNGGERHRWANHIFMLFLPLPTDIEAPLERLRAARQAAVSAKATWEHLPMHLMRQASATMPTWQIGPGAWLMSRMPSRMVPALYNVAVSNVRGPQARPVFDGREMSRYIVYGFVPPGIGLLLGGQSLGDRFVLSVTAARSVVPDFAGLPDLLQESLSELLAIADQRDADANPVAARRVAARGLAAAR